METQYNDKKIDVSSLLVDSKVISDDDKEIFINILKTGNIQNKKPKTLYEKNYILIENYLLKYVNINPLKFYNFVLCVMHKLMFLIIKADNQDTAMTIFNTLNDRGLPLTHADIFKAKLYGKANNKEKFIDYWKELIKKTEKCGNEDDETIDDLFKYYMMYERAVAGDIDTTTPGVRPYFLNEKAKRLFNVDLDKLMSIIDLMLYIYTRTNISGENWCNNYEIAKKIDIIWYYSNEWWKYPVIIYYLAYRNTKNFENHFSKFLGNLIRVLIIAYINEPTISYIKPIILKLNSEIIKSIKPKFETDKFSANWQESIIEPHRKLIKIYLIIIAYYYQKNELLPYNWEIEHILPQKFISTIYFDSEDKNREYESLVKHIGNLAAIEKEVNINASNEFFKIKKSRYSDVKKGSKLGVIRELCKIKKDVFDKEEIIKRDKKSINIIVETFDSWKNEYDNMK